MPLPEGVPTGTVVGAFLDDDGAPLTGDVQFVPTLRVLPHPELDPPVTIVNDGATATLVGGALSVELMATGGQFAYHVSFGLNKPIRARLIEVAAGVEQDLTTMADVVPTGQYVPVGGGGAGVQGPQGLSAYQVAVANGFVGDAAAWLASLHGADSTVPGPAGEDGADSTVPGPAGEDGADGVANIEVVAVLPALGEQLPGVFYVVQA